jgi:hypothetical protein
VLRLLLRVPPARDRTATATLSDGLRTLWSDRAVASVAPEVAGPRGNPGGDPLRRFGPPPFGTYGLVGLAPTPAEGEGEYGSHLLAFEPRSGPALQAESLGRLLLLAYAGPPGGDGLMRRTQGGLRLMPAMMRTLVARLAPDTELELALEPLESAPWWAFWKADAGNLRPLSSEAPLLAAPPLDEAALLAHVLREGLRGPRRRPVLDDTMGTLGDDSTTTDDRTRGGTTETPEAFEPGGGRFGGAGASGGWEGGPAQGSRPPGVDAAGRIVAAAAAAAALGAAAPGADSRSDTPGEAEGGTRMSTTY